MPIIQPPVSMQDTLAPWDSRRLPVQRVPDEYAGNVSVPGKVQTRSVGGFSLGSDVRIVASFDPHHYATLASVFFPTSATSVLILSQADTLRNFLLIRNTNTTANLFFEVGGPATTNSPLSLTPGQTALFDVSVPQNDIWFISDVADTGGAAIWYSTIQRPA